MSFVVATKDTSVFRVEISNVIFAEGRPDPNNCDFYYRINFDNFRRENSPVAKEPRWDQSSIVFMYTTKFVDQLITKMMTIEVKCTNRAGGDGFLGQAVIDLLTLATGPVKVVLTTTNGDFPTGKIQASIDVREVMDATVSIENCVVADCTQDVGPLTSCTLTVTKRGCDDGNRGLLPAVATQETATFEPPAQRFGLDADILFEGHCGLVFSLCDKNGDAVGRAVVDFTQLFSLYSTGSFSGDQQPSNASITTMLGGGKKRTIQDETSFSISREFTVDGAPESARVGTIKLMLKFDALPMFAQMTEGIVIDGHVWKGKARDGFPLPPFILA